jgi:peptide/nickel transport system permease protein
MLMYIIRRSIAAVIMLWVVSIVVFGIFYATPTDPARLTCGKNCTPALIAANRHFLGIDQPITKQYGEFLTGVFVGRDFPPDENFRKANPDKVTHCGAPCLGYSPYQTQLVTTIIKNAGGVTLSLAVGAFFVWIIVGVGAGIVAALFRGRFLDRFLVGLSLVFYSFPAFFIALLAYNYLSTQWQIFATPEYINLTDNPYKWFQGLRLPCLTLASLYAAASIRLTRAYMLETMGEDYLRTARAKGVSERVVVMKHTLRAALTPIVTVAGLDLGGLLAGAAITETVFNYQGLGRTTVQAVSTFDLPVIVGVVIVGAAFIIVANLIVDVLYGVIDPRVRYA